MTRNQFEGNGIYSNNAIIGMRQGEIPYPLFFDNFIVRYNIINTSGYRESECNNNIYVNVYESQMIYTFNISENETNWNVPKLLIA